MYCSSIKYDELILKVVNAHNYMKLLDIYIICIFFSGIELFLKVKGLRESGRYIVADMGHNC